MAMSLQPVMYGILTTVKCQYVQNFILEPVSANTLKYLQRSERISNFLGDHVQS